ncbi:hypothetical protein PG984_013170 [Apiospora sp. TS-2023a]
MTNLTGSTKSQSQSQSQLSYQNHHHHHHHGGYPFTNLDPNSSYSTSTKPLDSAPTSSNFPSVLSSFNTRTPTPTNAYPSAVAPIYSVAEDYSRPDSAATADSPNPFQTTHQKPTNFSNPKSFASRTSSPASAFHYNRGRTDQYSSTSRGATTAPSAADIGAGPGPTTSHNHATPNPSTFAARATSGSRDLGRGFDRDQILIGDSSDNRPPDETQSQRYPPLPPPHLAVTDSTEEGITGNNNNPGQAPSSLSLAPSGAAPVLLPRTSSLLPPPRNVGYAGLLKKEPIPSEPVTTKPRRSHSRASSIGVITDSFRNLNRWSASTSSSRASNRPGATIASVPERAGQDQRDRERGAIKEEPSPQQSTTTSRRSTFSRRMSVDSVAIIANATDPITSRTFANQSPRKLSKWRPSDGGTFSASSRSRANSNASSRLRPQENSPSLTSAPAPNLPPIVTLPSLEFPDAPSPEPATARPTDPPALAVNLFSRIGTDTSSPSPPYSSQGNNSRAGQRDHLGDEPTDPNNTNRGNSPTLLPAAQLIPNNTMPTESRGHTRSRSSNTKSSMDSTAPRDRDRGKQPSQKAMLSKALAKANTAVQLDNAQDYQSARQSYGEACDLLQHVLARTTGEEDKKKLEAIRRTYTSRIDELDNMVPAQAFTYNSKALPARPESLEYNGVEVRPSYDDDYDDSFYGTATTTRYGGTPTPDSRNLATPVQKEVPAPTLQSSFNKSPVRRNFEGSLSIPRAQDNYMPAPLSPRRPVSPARPASPPEPIVRQDFSMPADRLAPAIEMTKGHTRNLSHESTSWLDPIDESGGSAASSVHSRTSSHGYRRKHIRAISGDTEAEFDAALDAAVEAAYDEGYEVADSSDVYDDHIDEEDEDDRVVANAMRRVEWAKEQVRQTEREAAIEAARERDMQRRLQDESRISTYDEGGFYNGDSSDEEEERVLEDMTRNFAMQNFSFDQPSRQQSGTGRDRESDSSGVTQRTWHSSMGSNPPPTASTVLSTVTEMPPMSAKGSAPPPSLPPGQALPQIPSSNVRSRRLSGQNAKQLKIETAKVNPPPPTGPTSAFQAKPGNYIAQQRGAMSATSTRPGPFSNRIPSSPGRNGNPPMAPPTPPSPRHNRVSSEEYDEFEEMRTDSPSSARPALRKNQSSSSLRSQKTRQMSVATVDIPDTPMTSLGSRQPPMPTLPTPIVTAFSQKITGGFGGLYLFDSDFHSPLPPGSPTSSVNQLGPEVPLPLEPCPSDAMLRPFWLMRALYQTLCHPRGGYITNKLFVPRDVWKVKGVKLRALDDKSSQCDLLTAALMNLARVDSNDADAVLEEMQSFENVLEQVQVALTKKLGNEVGLQGMTRESGDGDAMPAVPRSASVSGKGAFSWRRLRSKGSAANMSSAYGSKGNSGGGHPSIPEKEVIGNGSGTLPSLPMVANPSSRPAKRDVHNVQFDGPYALYMLSLARLFDAAQTVDQIARQVDDPGLRHADKTQVGLELCTRHAAEFFGFYICRFVLSDLGLLLDKFVKRGSEWVLV